MSARATERRANTDASPATRSFTVATAPPPDTTAPDTTISSGPNSATNDATPTFAFTATESGSTLQCQLHGGAWTACTSPKTYSGLALGQHTAAVRATDAAGNVESSAASASWTTVTLLGAPAGAPVVSGGSGSANHAPTVTLSAPPSTPPAGRGQPPRR